MSERRRNIDERLTALEVKMNLIGYLSGAALAGVITLLVVVLGHI